jgi:hypothetical protein
LYPSVWRDSGCESHFIIWRDEISLFGRYAWEEAELRESEEPLREAILAGLSDQLVPFGALADALDAVPWDVLTICRRLVRDGLAREGTGKQRGSFARR